jgi:hypothetical protein
MYYDAKSDALYVAYCSCIFMFYTIKKCTQMIVRMNIQPDLYCVTNYFSIVTCWWVRVTSKMSSSSDDWIYYHLGFTFTPNYTYIQSFHSNLLRLFLLVFTNCFLATDLNTATSTLNHYEIFTSRLLILLQL